MAHKSFFPYTIITLMLSAMTFTGCNFLDIDPYIDLFTIDSVFKKQEYVRQYLNNMYSYMVDYGSSRFNPADNNRTMPFKVIGDDCVPGFKRNVGSHNYAIWPNNGLTSAQFYGFDRWDSFYEGIRKANTFITRVDECQEVTHILRQEWTGEALFVKAALYFELMLTWGPVPIVPDEPVYFDTPLSELLLERSTWDECSDYVESLLRGAIDLLPETKMDASEAGKATKNAARAILSRLTLYTASPLFNGQNEEFASFKNKAGIPYLNPERKMEKWAKAAATAKELVDLKPNDLHTVPKMLNTPDVPVPDAEKVNFPDGVGGIDHYHSYLDMFNGENTTVSTNIELLFTKQMSDATGFGRLLDPAMIDGWSGFYFPQRIVDAYYMADGRDIRNASTAFPYEREGYTTKDSSFSGNRTKDGFTILSGTRKWYVNREIRFYATVAFNNSFYPSISTPPESEGADGKVALFFSNSVSGKEAAAQKPYEQRDSYAMTGYLCRKFNHYEDSWLPNGKIRAKYGIAYRMAEVYLNYVEAMNELDRTYTVNGVTVARDAAEMKRCFNLIRHRVGLPGITDEDVANPARMRELIERERLLELMWEGRRYFDTRRNKTAVIHENEEVTGLDVSALSSDPEQFYTVSKVQERNYLYKVFTDRQTFWPIPKHEMDKNPNLKQMEGYY